MACDGRVSRIRQTELDDAGAAFAQGLADGFAGHEAIDQKLLDLVALQRGRAGAADELRAAPQQGHLDLLGGVCRQQLFFGHAAALHQLPQACCRQGGVWPHALLDPLRQGQVHVVAAQHEVVAHANAGELGLVLVVRHLNQGEVGGATAHVTHQHQAGVAQGSAQVGAVPKQPIVKGRLRFFQQAQTVQARLLRGGQGEAARAFVKRSGHGEHDVLFGQRRVGKAFVPRRLHMGQVAGAGVHRRDLGDVVRRSPRQDGGGAVYAGVRQPAFGAADQATGHLGAQVARIQAEHRGHGGWPRQVSCIGGRRRPCRQVDGREFAGCGVVPHGGQQLMRGHLPGAHLLPDGKQVDGGVARHSQLSMVGIRDHGVTGAEVDPDGVACAH